MPGYSNGNSFSNGPQDAGRSREPWLTSGLLRAIQDRGSI